MKQGGSRGYFRFSYDASVLVYEIVQSKSLRQPQATDTGDYNRLVATAVSAARMAPAPRPARTTLAGFLLSGFLFALLGAVLPAWGYHRDPPEFITIGNCFLSLAVGVIAANPVVRGAFWRKQSAFSAGLRLRPGMRRTSVRWPWQRRRRTGCGACLGWRHSGWRWGCSTRACSRRSPPATRANPPER